VLEHRHATATAQARAAQTAIIVRAHARATARVIAQRTAAPRETAVTIQRARAAALARAHAQATRQVIAQAHAMATSQAQQTAVAGQAQVHAAETQALTPTKDTYADVNDHPDTHGGDAILWTCNIAKFLGPDANDTSSTDVGCWEYTGMYGGGAGDGEIMMVVPPAINTDSMHSGDDVRVYGLVDDVPFEGTNAFGATITVPQIQVLRLTDLGHDPNASS
jgi:hypothetical protein